MRSLRVPATPVKLSEEEGGGWLEVGKGGSYDELVQRELVGRGLLPVVEAAWGTGGEEVAGKVRFEFLSVFSSYCCFEVAGN